MLYADIEPFGPRRDDERAGTVASILANVHRDRDARSEPFGWLDWFPDPGAPFATGPAPDLASKIRGWVRSSQKRGRLVKVPRK